MKKRILLLFAVLVSVSLQAAKDYDNYFTPDRLRIDLQTAGNDREFYIFLERLNKEGNWAGPRVGLDNPLDRGDHFIKVFAPDGTLIYANGFNTLFREWRTTAQAKQTSKTSALSLWMPFPKEKVKVVIYDRPKDTGTLTEKLSFEVDPSDTLIVQVDDTGNKYSKVLDNGSSECKVDLVFLAEGYTAAQMPKFRADVARHIKYMHKTEPYKNRMKDFNIWLVETISKDSEVDIPQGGIWKNTALDSHFNTFYSDRYLTLPDHKLLCQAVSGVPCDALYVIANTDKYGGGGMFNFYGMSSSDHQLTLPVFIHEFGHSFAGLADEYYTSDTSYEEFFNLKTEPWEPNITTKVNFASKWSDMIESGITIPTPNDPAYGSERVGLFEGGGYMTKGIYRPTFDCRMKSNEAAGFCPVCRKAINDMIDYYTGARYEIEFGFNKF